MSNYKEFNQRISESEFSEPALAQLGETLPLGVSSVVDGGRGDSQSVGLKIRRLEVRTPSEAQEKIVSFSQSKMLC